MAKLYTEEADYEEAIAMTRHWEPALEAKMAKSAGADENEDRKDRDRLRFSSSLLILARSSMNPSSAPAVSTRSAHFLASRKRPSS